MTPRSAAATEAARRLWSGATGGSATPGDVAAAATRLCNQLRAGLGRWVGGEGYRALLARAHNQTREEHPALGSLSCDRGDEPVTAEAVRAHGTAAAAAAIVALVAALIDLLGRIVGEEMAVRLVEQAGSPSPRGNLRPEIEGGRDG